MAATTVLAQAVIQFIAKGAPTVMGAFSKVISGAKEMASKMKESLDSVAKFIKPLAIAVNGFFLGFTRAAMQGTAEGDRFSASMDYLSRVIGDMFAPIVRLATDLAIKLAKYIAGIDPATRMMAGAIIAGTGAVLGLIAAWPLLVAAISPVITIIGAILSPFGLLVAGVAAVTTAITAAIAPFVDWSKVLESIVEAFMDVYSMITSVADGLGSILTPALEGFGTLFEAFYSTIIAPVVDLISKAWGSLGGSMSISWKGAVKWIGDAFMGVVGYMFELINMISDAWQAAVNKIAEGMAWLGEKAGMLEQGTLQALRDDIARTPPKKIFDTDAIWGKMGEASNKMGIELEKNGERAKLVAKKIEGGVKQGINEAAKVAKAAGAGGGFKINFKMAFEGIGDTFNRLQLAMNDPSTNLEQAQLTELQKGNQLAQEQVAAINKIQLVK